jgi:hypothetical protein
MWAVILKYFGPPAVALVGAWLFGESKWGAVRTKARKLLADPEETNDPRVAVAKALLEAQLERLSREAKKVVQAFPEHAHVNGTNPIPRLDIEVTEQRVEATDPKERR